MVDEINIQVSKTEEEVPLGVKVTREFDKEGWQPKTELGRKVKAGEITNIDQILDRGLKILEPQIVDCLLSNLESDLIMVGQSKGKFGGGKRSIWRQTQKKTAEGNKPSFSSLVVVGNRNGYVGIGIGKGRETMPAREKALRKAKLNIIKIRRGCGSWECGCATPHTIPLKVEARCGSVRIKLIPAPQGTNLSAEKEIVKLLSLAGIKDIYSKGSGQTRTKLNFITACFNALKKLSGVKIKPEYYKKAGIVEGLA